MLSSHCSQSDVREGVAWIIANSRTQPPKWQNCMIHVDVEVRVASPFCFGWFLLFWCHCQAFQGRQKQTKIQSDTILGAWTNSNSVNRFGRLEDWQQGHLPRCLLKRRADTLPCWNCDCVMQSSHETINRIFRIFTSFSTSFGGYPTNPQKNGPGHWRLVHQASRSHGCGLAIRTGGSNAELSPMVDAFWMLLSGHTCKGSCCFVLFLLGRLCRMSPADRESI